MSANAPVPVPLLAVLIARREGFGIPGALPTRNNNPGDLRHSPHSEHTADAPDAVGDIETPEDGWYDLVRQLNLYAERGLTVDQVIAEYAPPPENDTAAYLDYVLNGNPSQGIAGLGCPPDTPVAQALTQMGESYV